MKSLPGNQKSITKLMNSPELKKILKTKNPGENKDNMTKLNMKKTQLLKMNPGTDILNNSKNQLLNSNLKKLPVKKL